MVVNRSEGITSMDIFITINLPEKVKLVYYKCIRLAIGDVLPIKKILILRCIKVTDVIISYLVLALSFLRPYIS